MYENWVESENKKNYLRKKWDLYYGFDNKPQEYIYCYNKIHNFFNENVL